MSKLEEAALSIRMSRQNSLAASLGDNPQQEHLHSYDPEITEEIVLIGAEDNKTSDKVEFR